MNPGDATSREVNALLETCLCLDLEVARDGRILHLGAVLGGATLQARGGVRPIVGELDRMAASAKFLLGHNITQHDLPVLRSFPAVPARLLELPVIDTLYLSPLAFPQNPYHALVKDYKLVRASVNDPVADARLAAAVFADQWEAFAQLRHTAPELLRFFRYSLEAGGIVTGAGALFEQLGAARASREDAAAIFEREASQYACLEGAKQLAEELKLMPTKASALGYALAWLRVSGSNSVLPAWVRRQFPEVLDVLHRLRDQPCQRADCPYCHETHDPRSQLKRFFDFEAFRPEPSTAGGQSLQEAIVAHGMKEQPLLAILPTGGGKSLCFQIPALARNYRRGMLTVVISPLQALMKDQVDNLTRSTGTPFAGAIYGMLTPPERGTMLEQVRQGNIAILYLSPEQLRNPSIRETLRQREIGGWVFDEAHCFSKWGHDFRPDYHYASRFIREFAAQNQTPVPPIACFTATAKADVREEIVEHFRRELGQELIVYDGGAERTNLAFEIQTINASQKWERTHEILSERLPLDGSGSAVIYSATQKGAEEAARYLQTKDWSVDAYHAGMETPEKRRIQESFINGEIRVICATNAFGMGIDKDDVRLVIHLDIPGSLENYLQEAGRAGRDRREAECILLFDEQDVEKQFKLGSLSQLTRKDIAQILRGLRSSKRNEEGEVIITAGELLRNELVEVGFHYGERTAETKVRTAIAVLEKTGFIERNQNRTRVFQGRPLVASIQEAKAKIAPLGLSPNREKQWLSVLELLMNSRVDDTISADSVAELPEFVYGGPKRQASSDLEGDTGYVLRTLNEMAEAGLIRKDLLMTAFIRHKVVNPSWQLLERVTALERAMLDLLRQEEPDAEGRLLLSLPRLNQRLLDEGHVCLPSTLLNLLKSIARDGKGMAGRQGSIDLQHRSKDQLWVILRRSWGDIATTAKKRQAFAKLVLDLLISKIPAEAPARADFLVEFSEGDLNQALEEDMLLKQGVRNRAAAFEHAFMYLHDQHIIILQQGLAIFRQAMTVRIIPEAKERRFTQGDFSQLDQHYQERTFQVHVMHEYARLGLETVQQALTFVGAYFTQSKDEFLRRYFSGRREVLKRATGAESYRRIVESLNHPVQQAIVAAGLEDNMLVLAGPGSGKSRVVAHRCAYLLRVARAPAQSILVLCFNRNAAISLRKRISELAGEEARGVAVQTYHGLALRLAGVSLAERVESRRNGGVDFNELIRNAIELITNQAAVPGAEPDELRERLLGGYRHILVDEYQDIDQDQYALVSAIAGRTLADPDRKLSIMAVGDDDQNIYSFRGANVGFIRQFEEDYRAKRFFLIENYRSTRAIIDAANHLISHNSDRMKTDRPITPDRARLRAPDGGRWHELDPITRGRVRLLRVGNGHEQAAAVLGELHRLKECSPEMHWGEWALLARTRDDLLPVRAVLEASGIPLIWGPDRERLPPLHRVREVAQWLSYMKALRSEIGRASALLKTLRTMGEGENPWWQMLEGLTLEWLDESDDAETSYAEAGDFFYEALAQRQREPALGEGIFLSTLHSAKGMEFPHTIILGGGWRTTGSPTQEEERRLYYVGMTRARETLTLLERADQPNPHTPLLGELAMVMRPAFRQGVSEETTSLRYDLLTLEELNLGYPGCQVPTNPLHQRLQALTPGAELHARLTASGHVELCDPQGQPVARLSARGSEQWRERLPEIRSIRVVAMIARTCEDGATEYSERYVTETWEVPVVEIRWYRGC